MLFVIDSVIEGNTEMQPTNTVRAPVSQQDVTVLRVGTKSEAFGRILNLLLILLVEGQLEAMRGVVLTLGCTWTGVASRLEIAGPGAGSVFCCL